MTSGWNWWKAPWAVFKSPQTVPADQDGCADNVIQDKALPRDGISALNSAPTVGRKSFSFPTLKSRKDSSRTSRSLTFSRKATMKELNTSPISSSNNTMADDKLWVLVPCGLARTEKLRKLIDVAEHIDPVSRKETTLDVNSEKPRKNIEECSLFEPNGYTDTEYIQKLHSAFEPELERLKKASPTVESSSVVKDGILKGNLTPSQLIYDGERYPEVERTLTGMLVLKWILTGDYIAMTRNQKDVVKLPLNDFNELKERFVNDLRSPTEVYSLMVAMIINDLGKDGNFLLDMQKVIADPDMNENMNHDLVIYRAAKHQKIELLEEFNPAHAKEEIHLSKAERKECQDTYDSLLAGLELGSTLNLGQLCQAENVPGSLSVLKTKSLRDHRHTVNLKFLEIVLDVAGAQGHIDSTCSRAWISPVNKSYEITRKALKLATDTDTDYSLRYSYDKILRSRYKFIWPEKKTTVHEDLMNRETRALVRLITMGRASDASAASPFMTAFERFKSNYPALFKELVDGMDVDGDEDGTAIIPYYAPGTISEITRVCNEYHAVNDKMTDAEKQSTTQAREETRLKCLEQFYVLLAKVYRGTAKQSNPAESRIVECNLEFVQEVIRAKDFPKNPETLGNCEIPLEAYSVSPASWYVETKSEQADMTAETKVSDSIPGQEDPVQS